MIYKYFKNLTIYQFTIAFLSGLLLVAVVFCFKGILAFDPWSLVWSAVILLLVSLVTNEIFSWAFDANSRYQSAIIAALILVLIISPPKTGADVWFLFWAATLAMASKYILAIKKVHIFNPAAIAVVITALAVGQFASWWVGTRSLLPYVIVGGLLVVYKMRKWQLIWYFGITVFITTFIFTALRGTDVLIAARHVIQDSSLFFFAFVMLTEPMTTPVNKKWQIVYGIIVGILFSPQIHFGSLYLTPELALVFGNIFVYFVKPNTVFGKMFKKTSPVPISTNSVVPPANSGQKFNGP